MFLSTVFVLLLLFILDTRVEEKSQLNMLDLRSQLPVPTQLKILIVKRKFALFLWVIRPCIGAKFSTVLQLYLMVLLEIFFIFMSAHTL